MKFGRTGIGLAAIALLLLSCTKEKSNETPDLNSGIYLPNTTGSTWHYADSTTQVGFTLKATDRIDSINKIRFYYYENQPDDPSLDTTFTLIGRAGYNYYISAFLPELGDGMLMILKQDAVPGEQWAQKILVPGYDSVTLRFTMEEKGITYAAGGQTYHQVVHVGIGAVLSLDTGSGTGNDLALPVGELYFAAGIGIVALHINLQGQAPAVHLILTDYDIR